MSPTRKLRNCSKVGIAPHPFTLPLGYGLSQDATRSEIASQECGGCSPFGDIDRRAAALVRGKAWDYAAATV